MRVNRSDRPRKTQRESWRKIKNYPGYLVSSQGRIKSTNFRRSGQERLLKFSTVRGGYLQVTLSGKNRKKFTVHRLVAAAFIDNPGKKRHINHKNGDKTDNRVTNLEYVTHLENERHKIEVLNKGNEGAKNGMAKLDNRDVFIIRKLLSHQTPYSIIMDTFDISSPTITEIKTKKTWSKI